METIRMTRAEIDERTARYAKLERMSTLRSTEVVPLAARDLFVARTIMPIVIEKTANAFGDVAAIYGAAGLTMNISICPPGQGPGLHAHHKTYETFMVLQGRFEFSLNDDGAEKVLLEQYDTISVPPRVNRAFRNVAETDSMILTVITGGVHDRNDISLQPDLATKLAAFGPDVLGEVRKLGISFDAGAPQSS